MVKATLSRTIGRRYVIEHQLGTGGMGVVYRATDRLTGQSVAIKSLLSASESRLFASQDDTEDERLALAREFQSLASLRHPNIIGVLDYGFDEQGHPFFTMELLENARNIRDAAQDQPVQVQVGLLVQVLQALAYLHRRGFLHRDLKPGNVMVVNADVKVVDFGLATASTRVTGMSGTLAYMAPEVLEQGQASTATDLFAVGVMAYEIFAKQHPFETSSLVNLMEDILHKTPPVHTIGVNDKIATILLRLMAKVPEDRYPEAEQVIEAFSDAIDQPLSVETRATRESFLQAARLVGRDAELAQLTSIIADAVLGKGSALLVGGESGVGKSRLLDEVKTLALIRGAVVLRGQSISDGGSPYQIWREVLRRLSLDTELDDLEASVLKALVPDIGTLLGQSVSDAPDLEPQAAQTRLLNVVEAVFRRQHQPVVVIIVDLHWGGSENFAVFNWLTRVIQDLPLLIIGSYRDDERPDVPDNLPGIQTIKLQRLPTDAIAELSESMLGAVGRQPQVLNLLRRETEGNVFFLVEVARALAEIAGQLDQIGNITLPGKVFSGGIQNIVQRRLERVPEEVRGFLRVAAVAGRQLDLSILRTAEPGIPIDDWLIVCANAAVLEVQEEQWRFAHDKLREGLLADIPEDERRKLHSRVAVAIEGVYPNTPENAATLAHHWNMAGDSRKESYYAGLAGDEALRSGANHEAVTFYTRALALQSRPMPLPERLATAHLERQLGRAYMALGNLNQGGDAFKRSLTLLGYPMPATKGKLVAGLLGQILGQVYHRIRPASSGRSASMDVLLEGARCYETLSEVYFYYNDLIPTLYSALRMLNLAESAGPSPELARGYAAISTAAGLVPVHGLARYYSRRAEEIAQSVNDPFSLVYVLVVTRVYDSGVAAWDKLQGIMQTAPDISRRLGNQRFLGHSLTAIAQGLYYRGKFSESAGLYNEVYTSAVHSNNLQQQIIGFNGQAQSILRLAYDGYESEMLKMFEAAKSLLVQSQNRTQEIIAHSVAAQVYLRTGSRKKAFEIAQGAMWLILKSPPTIYSILLAYSSVAEVALTLLEDNQGETEAERTAFFQLAGQACKALKRYTRIFPIGQPHLWLWTALLDWQTATQRSQPPVDQAKLQQKLQQSLQKSLHAAQKLEMLYEEGQAYYEIGRHLAADDPARKENLNRACEIFKRLDCAYDLKRAEAALGT